MHNINITKQKFVEMKYSEDLFLEYNSLDDLSYCDSLTSHIDLYHKDIFVGYVEVWTDEDEREYIIINNDVVYLDTIENITEFNFEYYD